MNLTKLFDMQKVLRDRIDYYEPDRFNKLVLALLVELGECANEWRGFKFWSKRQKPYSQQKLLEEYVDGLHFILDLGLENGFESEDFPYLHEHNFDLYTVSNANDQFIQIYLAVTTFECEETLESYEEMFLYFIGLGKHLGFTWEQIEQAYIEKNEINHQRQDNGY